MIVSDSGRVARSAGVLRESVEVGEKQVNDAGPCYKSFGEDPGRLD